MDAAQTISSLQALVLGVVEGITEFLPISSTGHLVITSDLLGHRDASRLTPTQIEAVQAFEIVIQSGAILAVLLLYRHYIYEILRGLAGKSRRGLRLLLHIGLATAPVLAVGYLAKDVISRYLQFTGPVVLALAVGGVVMVTFEQVRARSGAKERLTSLETLTWRQALAVGAIQCVALWPGSSRSMVTIIGGMSVGLSRAAAAEFSFLIGLPTLLAATAYKMLKNGGVLQENVGTSSLLIGFAASAVFAFLAVKWFVAFLNRRGLAVFGWYRLALAPAVAFVFLK